MSENHYLLSTTQIPLGDLTDQAIRLGVPTALVSDFSDITRRHIKEAKELERHARKRSNAISAILAFGDSLALNSHRRGEMLLGSITTMLEEFQLWQTALELYNKAPGSAASAADGRIGAPCWSAFVLSVCNKGYARYISGILPILKDECNFLPICNPVTGQYSGVEISRCGLDGITFRPCGNITDDPEVVAKFPDPSTSDVDAFLCYCRDWNGLEAVIKNTTLYQTNVVWLLRHVEDDSRLDRLLHMVFMHHTTAFAFVYDARPNYSGQMPNAYKYGGKKRAIRKRFMGLAGVTDEDKTKFLATFHMRCENCGMPADSKCSGCKIVYYCTRECQTSHWKGGHKLECKQLIV